MTALMTMAMAAAARWRCVGSPRGSSSASAPTAAWYNSSAKAMSRAKTTVFLTRTRTLNSPWKQAA